MQLKNSLHCEIMNFATFEYTWVTLVNHNVTMLVFLSLSQALWHCDWPMSPMPLNSMSPKCYPNFINWALSQVFTAYLIPKKEETHGILFTIWQHCNRILGAY